MQNNEIGQVRYLSAKEAGGYPAMEVEIDGKVASFVKGYVKLTLIEQGIVPLSDEAFENQGYSVFIPANPALGIPEQTMDPATDDPKVVKLVREYLTGD